MGVHRIQTVQIIPGSGLLANERAIIVGTDIGVFVSLTSGLGNWVPMSANLPRTWAYSLAYDSTDDVLIVGTLGRGAWKLNSARSAVFGINSAGSSHLHGSAPGDLTYDIILPIVSTTSSSVPIRISSTDGTASTKEVQSLTINATHGNFTLSFGGNTTVPLTAGSEASVVQSALQALTSIGSGNVLVTKSGNTYTITFQTNGNRAEITGEVVVSGVVKHASVPAEFVNNFKQNMADVLGNAGLSSISIDVVLDSNGKIAITPTGFDLKIRFASPFKVDSGGGRFTVNTPGVNYSYDPSKAAVSLDRRLEINLRYTDAAFQELGLTSSPTRFDYTGVTTDAIEITLSLNGTDVPVSLASSSSFRTLDDFIAALQAAVNSALVARMGASDGLGGALGGTAGDDTFTVTNGGASRAAQVVTIGTEKIRCTAYNAGTKTYSACTRGFAGTTIAAHSISDAVVIAPPGVTVCRLNIDPNADDAHKCSGNGNRVTLKADTDGVTNFSLDIQPYLGGTTTPNGAITELGFTPVTAENHRSRASRFFLEDVHLTGGVEVVIPDATLRANIGFLAVKATGSGTQGAIDDSSPATVSGGDRDRVVALVLDVRLKNPLVSTSNTALTNRIDLTTLSNAIRDGKFLFDNAMAGGSVDHPGTGFFSGSLSGGLGVKLDIAPDGALAGLADTLNAHLEVGATSADWFTHFPSRACNPPTISTDCYTVSFTGPDFSALLSRFQTLDFASIVQALHIIVQFLHSLDGSDGSSALASILNQPLPLVNKSISQMLDVADELATKINDVVSNPSGAIQKLGNTLANVLGKGPAIIVTTTQAATGSVNEIQKIHIINSTVGRFRLKFAGATTADIPYGSSQSFVETKLQALSALDDVDVVKIDNNNYTIEFKGSNANTDVDPLGTDASDLAGDILSFDPGTGQIDFKLDLGFGTQLSRPFSMDLSSILPAGLAAVIGSLVSVNASGNLAVHANATLQLRFGVDTTGTDKSVFIKTGALGTALIIDAGAAANDLSFEARVGPFGLFVKHGSAAVGGTLNLHLLDPHSNGRMVLLGLSGSSVTSDVGSFGSFIGTSSIGFIGTAGSGNFAAVSLPLFVGTQGFQIPNNDPALGGSGAPGGNLLGATISVDVSQLFSSPGSAFTFHFATPDWTHFQPQLPSLFALLADPSVVVDGLDSIMGALQDAISGRVLGVKLPFVGDLLANNPVANLIGGFRGSILQPLATLLRENNAGLDSIVHAIQGLLFSIFHDGLQDVGHAKDPNDPNDQGVGSDGSITQDDIVFRMLRTDRTVTNGVNVFNAQEAEFLFKYVKDFPFQAPEIGFDLGLPVLGLNAKFQPEGNIHFELNFGFGVDTNRGFYFVADNPLSGGTDEISLSASVVFSDVQCNGTNGTPKRAEINGNLLFLALHMKDGTDLNGDGKVTANTVCANTPTFNPHDEELTRLFFGGSIDIADPEGAAGHGMLTFTKLFSSSLTDIFKPTLSGGAVLRSDIRVDFSTLGGDFGNVLPSIEAKLLVDFAFRWSLNGGFDIMPPQVILADITLDLGSFISKFAGPILDSIGKILDPLKWLIGPDGFLNKRIPLLSDLAGKTITGKDLVIFFDPDDGPKIVAFLDFVLELYRLIDLVKKASSEGPVKLNFGDLVLVEGSHTSFGSGGFSGSPITSLPDWNFIDSRVNLGLPAGVSDLRNMASFAGTALSNIPAPSFEGTPGSSTSEFTAGVTHPGGVEFPLIQDPSKLINLILGKPLTLVIVNLPELGFNFNYRQMFPIIGPLVGTFEGGIGASLKISFGYDTLGLQEFFSTHNAASLLKGFFFCDLQPCEGGSDVPEATLHAEIAVGAALSIVIATVGVEGGIDANINFNFADLDGDGKIRFDEMKANVLANDGDPLAVFDISGELDFFLRAYIEINLFITKITYSFEFARLKLLSFDVPFKRPAFLGTQNGDTLTLAIGPNSKNRLLGNLDDIGEEIHVKGDAGTISVWSSQFNRDEGNAQTFSGVHKIIASGGAGDDIIDLGGVNDDSITFEIHGNGGNDKIIGPAKSACDDAKNICAQLFGDDGNDTLTSMLAFDGGHANRGDVLDGGQGDDTLIGGPAASLLKGGAGADKVIGGAGNETIDPGSGDDSIDGGAGINKYLGINSGSIVHISTAGPGTETLDMSGRTETLHIYLKDGMILVGWGDLSGSTGAFISDIVDYIHEIRVDHLDAFTTILGGKGADISTIYQTAAAVMTLDGQGGNDTYDFIDFGNAVGHQIKVDVNDRGNPWDSGDQIVIDGSSVDDTIVVTDAQITGTGSQTVTYHHPDPDKNVLAILVNGNDGADRITVDSTRDVVPVKIDGGAGNDIVNIGGGSLSDVKGLSRPGVQIPFGLGPVVVVGGAGLDTLIADDHSDSTGRDGTLVSWIERRQTAPDGTEVGGVGGLGMTLFSGFDAGTLALTGAGPGRIEFEDFEGLSILLGSGDDNFTVGGDALRPQLPATRQRQVFFFDQSPAVMASISGGNGNDTFPILSTVKLDRTAFDASDGLITINTLTQGMLGTVQEKQHINIHDGAIDTTNTFRLTYTDTNGPHTTGLLNFNDGNAALQTALRALPGLSAVTVTDGSGVFDVTFPNSLGNVNELLATFSNKLVSASTTTPGVQGTTDEVQFVRVRKNITDSNGFFTVKYKFMETAALPLDVSVAAFQTAIRNAFTFAGAPTNLTATDHGGLGFDIDFNNILGDVDLVVPQVIPMLIDGGNGTDRFRVASIYEDTFFYGGQGTDSANVNLNAVTLAPFTPGDVVGHVTVSQQPNDGSGETVERVDVTNVTGGTFQLSFNGQFTTPIAWDAPATGQCVQLQNSTQKFCSVQQALMNLSSINLGADPIASDPNVNVTKSDVDGSYMITFVKALGHAAPSRPACLSHATPTAICLASNLVIASTQAGTGTHDAIQQIAICNNAVGSTCHNELGGSFSLDYTYDVRPLGLATDPNAVGTLTAGTYYYVVTAITGEGQTLPSAEVHTTLGNNGAVKLSWGEVTNAVSYRVWRGTGAGAQTGYLTSVLPNVFDDGIVALTAGTLPTTTAVHARQTTIPIEVNAAPAAVQAALVVLPQIGRDTNGNDNVLVTGTPGNYTIQFTNALGHRAVALLQGGTSSLRSNGINAIVTMDGGGGGDTYDVHLIGGRTRSLINVFDSGVPGDGGDSLNVTGTDFPDVFLLRAATSDQGLAFAALINGPTPLTPAAADPFERVNYNQQLESIVINGGNGDDQFYVDDTRTSITVNGDQGNDFFQIGQLYRSRRTPELASVAPEDVFATIQTTQGWLSNGISKPMTINGGVGNDNFIVFHNLDTLNLFGDEGNDNFLVQAFALAGSQEDHRALTDLSGGGGADLIQYAVNAPVNIDGGDGFDTVVIIGTEFNDDFVVTSTGVFGAGLHVSFVNIEALTVDGGAGDDRFFVQSTGPTFTTEIDGGLGSDFISVEGPTPVNGVISNDLLGHSGIITHSVESTDGSYDGLNVVGVSANVADDDTPSIVVTETDGGSLVVQSSSGTFSTSNHTKDNFAVALTRPIGTNTQVVVNIQPPEGLALLDSGGNPFIDVSNETQSVSLIQISSGQFRLHLDAQQTSLLSWDSPAATVRAALEALSNVGAGNVQVMQTGTVYAITFINGKGGLNINQMTADAVGTTPGGTIKVQTSVNGGFSLAKPQSLVFDDSNWWIPQQVWFVVDVMAEKIGTNLYFQNSATVRCSNQVPPLPDPAPAPNCTGSDLIKGTVVSAPSIDQNPHTVGDEYATVTANTPVFASFLPSADLPEGLRGTNLKISGNDPEAEGQIRLVLGSYLTHVTIGAATGGSFTLTFGSLTTGAMAYNATAAAVKSAIEAVLGDNMVDVSFVGGIYDVALRGTLFLSNDVHFLLNSGGLVGGSPSIAIDGSSLKVNSPWSSVPNTGAAFEVSLFGGVKVPAVRVSVYSAQHAQIVVAETGTSTNVSQDGTTPTSDEIDHISVRLSGQPIANTDVTLGDHGAGLVRYFVSGSPVTVLHFTTSNWNVFQDVEVRAVDDGVIRGFHRADLSATAPHYFSYLSTILIGDNHWPGVRVIESGGSTNVIEQHAGGSFGNQADAFTGSPILPALDDYTVALTKQPTADVYVTVQAQPTRTSQTGGIVSFAQQVDVSIDGGSTWGQTKVLHFTSANWNFPQTVLVRAHQDTRVDGQDTQVFAPQLQQLNAIQGPLFVNGGEGANRTGLLEREPVMLPGELNQTPSMGHVISSTPGTLDNTIAATITIEHSLLSKVVISAEPGTSKKTQSIAVDTVSGTMKLTYGAGTTDALAFNAPAVTIEDALRPLLKAVDAAADLTVSQNASEYQVIFRHTTLSVLDIGQDLAFNSTHLGPQSPSDLVGTTILITSGPAKNKSRIITGGITSGPNWTLTLDKPWFSPFTSDSTTPTSDSTYTLLLTNPNLLVDEATQANLLYMYDLDNPASFNDAAYKALHGITSENPFGAVQIFFDNGFWGPADEDGTLHRLNEFRVTGLGMGGTRCIGGPEDVLLGGCTGPVGANEPGGITFKIITDLELNLGDGANHVIIDTFTNVPDASTHTKTLDGGPADSRAPKTAINTAGGEDLVDIKGIRGHTFVNLGAAADTINVHNDVQRLTDLIAMLTVSGDSPQANVINYANGSPAQGTSVDPVDSIQILKVEATSGQYKLTYSPKPLNLSAHQSRLTNGTLAAGNYYYMVTAIMGLLGESLPSPEAYATVTSNGKTDLAWYPVPGATGYKVYRGTMPSGENALLASLGASILSLTDNGGAGTPASPPTLGVVQSVTVASSATASQVQSALESLSLIGSGNVEVKKAGGTYRIHFMGTRGGTAIALLGTDPADLRNGSGVVDRLNIVDTAASADGTAVLTSTSLTGLSLPFANETQQLALDATTGQYTLTYKFAVKPSNLNATQSSGGGLTAGAHYYRITAITPQGETLASNLASAITANNGAVDLTWTGLALATGYRIYRSSTQAMDVPLYLNTSSTSTSFHDTGGGTPGTLPVTSPVLDQQTTAPLAFDAAPATVQAALQGLPAIGTGNVVVTRNDDVYTIHFQGILSEVSVQQLVATRLTNLSKTVELLGGSTSLIDGTAIVHTVANLTDTPTQANQIQLLTVDATGGSFRLTFHVSGVTFQSDPIPYNAGAEQLRQIIQNAVAAAQTSDPFLRAYLVDKIDVTVDRYPNGYLNKNIYILNFQGSLRREALGPGVDTLTVNTSLLVGTADVITRMDGIQYYGIEQVDIATGSGSEVFDIQGTTKGSNDYAGVAVTNVTLNNGDDRVFMSSNAELDQNTWAGFDFLTGNLDDFRGALNVDLGLGRHRLLMSDEASSHPDNYRITDIYNAPTMPSLVPGADIYITRAGLPGISYKASPSGNLFDGVIYWTGSGDDTIYIDGTHVRPGARTMTLLNTGLGNDNITVSLDTGEDDYFALNTAGGSTTDDPMPLADMSPDNDTVDGSASTLPLVIFGGFGDDRLKGGHNKDIIFGDFGRVQYMDPATGLLIATVGFGGRADLISSLIVDPRFVISRHLSIGGVDIVQGMQDDDILVGGAGGNGCASCIGDYIDGNQNDDLIFGDSVELIRRDVNVALTGDITDPRFETLRGNHIYAITTIDGGVGETTGFSLVDGIARNYRDTGGLPAWAEYRIINLFHSFAIQAAGGNQFGNDYIAGGPDDDVIFGQLGNDTIQGDGSIDSAISLTAPVVVGAYRTPFLPVDPEGALTLTPSFEASTDGSDYVEGGGGNDVVFGNLGQDDLIGGSSSLFTLITPGLRPDGKDIIFGGAGTRVDRNNEVASTDPIFGMSHARDADTIASDNANIYRVVGINGVDANPAYLYNLRFNYDNPAFPGYSATLPLVVHAVDLLDYTPGGPDFDPAKFGLPTAGACSTSPATGSCGTPIPDCGVDIGAGDEVHAESGDDIIYTACGNDVAFGDAGDDNITGGWGNDWVSGGTGQDGVLGDDGRIYISRNSASYGEPLYGIAPIASGDLNRYISSPGKVQQATINVADSLKMTFDITPYNLTPTALGADQFLFDANNSDDVIFGGLGDDFLHGASGDDAVSGAEALAGDDPSNEGYAQRYAAGDLAGVVRSDFSRPYNTGDILHFGSDYDAAHSSKRIVNRLGEFALYDEYDARRTIELNDDGTANKTATGREFFLNFNSDQGLKIVDPTYGTAYSDGNDAIFGDLGNDWLIGGTGRDDMFGGWGNDLLQADDVLTIPDPTGTYGTGKNKKIQPSPNDTPDTHPSYEDRAYGGAGLDVLIGNTGGDRLIDWVGEFNSYIVPFAPFGIATVSRQRAPALDQFLYDLSKSDGADPTRAIDVGTDPARNGEPDGEIALVNQSDHGLWQEQTGGPSDPQAGNIPGGKRDVLRSADFNNGAMSTFAVDSGSFAVVNGAMTVSAASSGQDAAAVFYLDQYLPIYYEYQASVQVTKPTGGWKGNAYLIFDYQSPTDFKFAGINISTNKAEMGHRTPAGWIVDAQGAVSGSLSAGTYYQMLITVNGTNVSLYANGKSLFTYNFPGRVINGETYGLNKGMLGLGSNNSQGVFDNVTAQVLPVQVTFDNTEDFNDGIANLFTGPKSGTWAVNSGRYVGTPSTTPGLAASIVDLGLGHGLAPSSYLELSATLSTNAIGGIIFDRYAADDFKFVAIDARTGNLILGHQTQRSGWVIDSTFAKSIVAGKDYALQLTMKGASVSVSLDGLFVTTWALNAPVVDGAFGTLTNGGSSSFDVMRIRTDDSSFTSAPSALLLDEMIPMAPDNRSTAAVARLDEVTLGNLVSKAVSTWVGLLSGDQARLSALTGLHYALADFLDGFLGQAHGSTIYLDPDASGFGWAVSASLSSNGLAKLGSVDAMTAVLHELGHVLGFEHSDQTMYPFMAPVLAPIGSTATTAATSTSVTAPFALTVSGASTTSATEPVQVATIDVPVVGAWPAQGSSTTCVKTKAAHRRVRCAAGSRPQTRSRRGVRLSRQPAVFGHARSRKSLRITR
ncbi:MAG: hypothetical protein ABR507_11310 [Actinomycetota bacterium]